MSNKNISSNNLGTQTAAAISMLLPIIQFFYQWLPETFSGIFLGKQIFFYVSIITLILSLLVIFWYKSNPWFSFIPWWLNKKQLHYLKYLKEINPQNHTLEQIEKIEVVSPPFSLTPISLASISIPIVFIFTIMFIWIGISNQNPTQTPNVWLQVFQASLYSLSVVLCTFSATHFYLSLENQKEWAWYNQTKIQRAIQLAIENNGFSELPQIKYIESWDTPGVFPPNFIVQVKIKNKKYNLITDQRAEILKGVFQVENK